MHLGTLLRSAAVAAILIGVGAAGAVAVPTVAAADPAAPSPAPHAADAPRASLRTSFRLEGADGHVYTPNRRNIALRTATESPLLLFLPATHAIPTDYRQFLDTAGGLGYHVLALDYFNVGKSVTQTCGPVADCYSELQANRFDGSHPSQWSAVRPADSILARLRHALTSLKGRDPNGGWGRYLDGDRVRWDRVVLAGHSQGGGESAFIAHSHRVQGVLMFGSPVESYGDVTAAWMSTRCSTPADRYYAFDSVNDIYSDRITGSWTALHLPGAPQVIGSQPPARLGHQLQTDIAIGDPQQSHDLFIKDAGPRGERGAPLFRGVWLAMLRAVRGTVSTAS